MVVSPVSVVRRAVKVLLAWMVSRWRHADDPLRADVPQDANWEAHLLGQQAHQPRHVALALAEPDHVAAQFRAEGMDFVLEVIMAMRQKRRKIFVVEQFAQFGDRPPHCLVIDPGRRASH